MPILKSNVVLTRKTYRHIVVFTCMSIFCLLIAVIGRPLVNQVLDEQIEEMLVVDSVSAPGYEDWQTNVKEDGIPIWFKFWHFNLTNPEEVIAGTAKPYFVELGPYCYQELRSKINVTWDEEGNEVTYWTYKYFLFDKSCTADGLAEDDIIITTNLGLWTVVNNLANPDTGHDYWLNELLWNTVGMVFNEPLFIPLTARDLIFGYDEPIFAFLNQNVDDAIPAQLYIQLNLTSEEDTLLHTQFTTQQTGKDDIDNIANYIAWNGKPALDCWGSEEANAIYGTDGNNWPTKIDRDDVLVAFVDTAYRRARFVYQKDTTFENIDAYRFILDPVELLNVTNYPNNKQWFANGYNGLINITKCALGCPTFLSKARFLDSDQVVLDAIDGDIDPDREIHDTFADIEPRTGLTINIYKRIQINAKIRPIFMTYENVTDPIYMPITWIEESGYITHDLAKDFRHTVYTVEDSAEVMGWLGAVLAALFGAMALGLIIAVLVHRRRLAVESKERERLIERVGQM